MINVIKFANIIIPMNCIFIIVIKHFLRSKVNTFDNHKNETISFIYNKADVDWPKLQTSLTGAH